MEAQKKIEIVISTLDAREVIQTFEKYGHKAYTRIEDIKGRGERGLQDGQGLARAFSNDMLIFVVSATLFQQVKEELRELMTEYGGICLISDVQSLIH
jgi:nitrogen regulatory protein PII